MSDQKRVSAAAFFDILASLTQTLTKAERRKQGWTCEETITLDASGNATDGCEIRIKIEPSSPKLKGQSDGN